MSDKKTYFGLALDPLHVGAGGYRLGRVDLTIIRDPGTNLPKVPGSSLSGVCRNYAIYGLEGEEKEKAVECATLKDDKKRGNCGQCVICRSFGFASGQDKRNQMGLIKFFDASLVAFPVASMVGPVWVTTAAILKDLGMTGVDPPEKNKLISNFKVPGGKLNLGWLYLPCEQKDGSLLPADVAQNPVLKEISENLIVAPSDLFPEIVNSNLEVRTSVSIDFETGAAKSGALFTYEAIPRSALLAMDIVVDDDRCALVENHDRHQESPLSIAAEKVWDIVKSGLGRMEVLGLGGMNTRGFGRFKVVNL